ncbi:HEPN domain-containing protein [Sphingobium sp. B2]|uniref:HEPN domain-containing protein n=1 Tax=Sphingobium sp. B2 TaxID=2583228 RepID=UPI00119DE671|nr:HEPN domain-containing protein [Sphingobium sp. B2]
MRADLNHLPAVKRRELERVTRILFDEFEDAIKTKLSEKRRAGRILKLILFGSYARGDWVEDRANGYLSDYDLLVVVNADTFTDLQTWWARADDHLVRELTVTKHLATPVNFIVHSLMDVNDQLGRGQPFFTDIIRDGIALYEAAGHPFAAPKKIPPEESLAEARRHFDHWLPKAGRRLHLAQLAIEQGYASEAAFELHQAVEHLYHCALLTVTSYSPKSHRLTVLRSLAENLDPRLIAAWPRGTRFARRAFARLERAYVDARYSHHYEITAEELTWLVVRVGELQATIAAICAERLAGDRGGTPLQEGPADE